jgi:hypothetical protein
MYLSTLLINTGDNPDRPDWSITRRWLRNPYRVINACLWHFHRGQHPIAPLSPILPECRMTARCQQDLRKRTGVRQETPRTLSFSA